MTNTVSECHPELDAVRKVEFARCRVANKGQATVKSKGVTYLHKPSGFEGMADGGKAAYDIYLERAQFPEFMSPTVSAFVGLIHGDGLTIELPDALEYLRQSATDDKLPLEDFHRRITARLTSLGRYGVLADANAAGGDPYLIGYDGDKVINWDDDFFVIDQSEQVRSGFDWEFVNKHLVLELVDGQYIQRRYTEGVDVAEEIDARGVGGKLLTDVPFVLANAIDVASDIITPPLMGVCNAAISNYQLSADHRWQLYMSGQETLFVINGEAPEAVGAGVVVTLSGTPDTKPDAKYVGPDCIGIQAHERAMEAGKMSAAHAGARLLAEQGAAQESGFAKSIRYKSETASILTIATTSCAVLEKSLRHIAVMLGANPDDVKVARPKNLMAINISATDLAALWGVVESGGISEETFYARAQDGGIAEVDRSFEDEQKLITNSRESGNDGAI